MGKGVVLAKDSPNFIGNHLALYEVTRILDLVAAGEYSIEEVDAITGPAIGRPRSATFRTLDLAGIDILGHVVENLRERLSDRDAARSFALPAFVQRMLDAGLTGEKAGQGFYKRVKGQDGQSQILVIDPQTLEYGPLKKPTLGALAAAEPVTDLEARVRKTVRGRGSHRRLPASHARAHDGLRGQGDARHRAFTRRRGSRDAVGLRVGTRPLRADGRHRRPRGAGRGARGGCRWCLSGPAAAARDPRRRAQPASTRTRAARRIRSADPAFGKGARARRAVERRGEPGGSGRRRAGRGVPLEDERDRRRCRRHAAGGRAGGRRGTSRVWSSATTRRIFRPAPI